MKRLSLLAAALIGILASIVTLFATEYRHLLENALALFRYMQQMSSAYFDFLIIYSPVISIVAVALFTMSLRMLPTPIKQIFLGHTIGDVAVFENRDDPKYTSYLRKLLRASSTIDVIGIGNSQFVEQDWRYAVETNHAVVRVLFLNPDGHQIHTRERDEGHEHEWLSNQVRAHVRFFEETIEQVNTQCHYATGLIRYKFYDEYPSCNVVLFDRKYAFVQPYFFSRRGRANMIIFLTKSHSEVVNKMSREFERLWGKPGIDEMGLGTKKNK